MQIINSKSQLPSGRSPSNPLEPPPAFLSENLSRLTQMDRWEIVQFKKPAVDFIQTAIHFELTFSYHDALDKYENGSNMLQKALKYEPKTNIEAIEMLQNKLNQVQDRISRIQKYLIGADLEPLPNLETCHHQKIPSLNRLPSRDQVDNGIEFIQRGFNAEKEGDLNAALVLLSKGIEKMMNGMKEEPNDEMKALIREKIVHIMSRAENIKKQI